MADFPFCVPLGERIRERIESGYLSILLWLLAMAIILRPLHNVRTDSNSYGRCQYCYILPITFFF